MSRGCRHIEAHLATVSINYLEDSGRFCADIKIECACGRPFQFLGLPIGLDLDGATISADGQELRLGIAPVGEVQQPLDEHLLRGFRLRGPGDH